MAQQLADGIEIDAGTFHGAHLGFLAKLRGVALGLLQGIQAEQGDCALRHYAAFASSADA